MPLSAVVPTTMSELVTFMSAIVADVNTLWSQYSASAWIVGYREEHMAVDDTELVSSDTPFEVIVLAADGAVDLTNITGARKGMIKVIIADDNNVCVKHNVDKIILKGAADLDMEAGDVLILVNRDGDPDTATDGYWREVLRNLF